MNPTPIVYTLFIPLTLLFSTLLFSHTALAQADNQSGQTTQSSAALSEQNLEELITTLESNTARKAFIANLKTLLEAKREQGQQDDTIDVPVADTLPESISQWKDSYQQILDRYDLSPSTVTNIIGTASLILGALLITFILAKLINLTKGKTLDATRHIVVKPARIAFYFSTLKLAGVVIIAMITLIALLSFWDFDYHVYLPESSVRTLFEQFFSVLIVFVIGAVLLEAGSSFSEKLLKKSVRRPDARIDTLLPIVRTVISASLIMLFGFMMLSEIGIDIGPLLAGAGIFGLAFGFGAQTMVKDFLTGFIIILEDLIQVGDVAGLSGKIGIVEKITVRKVQLRDLDGTVYTIPYSAIDIVENLTKDFSYYMMDVGVAYREDTDEVIRCLEEVDEQMRQEEEYKALILEPIDILGVDKFADSAVIIKARIKTQPIKQWTVGREFNRRLKMLFDQRNIEIPFPHRTLYFGEEKAGGAPPAYVHIDGQNNPNRALENDNGQPDSATDTAEESRRAR